MKYYMNGLEKSIMEISGMLKTTEESIVLLRNTSSTILVLTIREGGVKRKRPSHPTIKGIGKGKMVLPIPTLKRTFMAYL